MGDTLMPEHMISGAHNPREIDIHTKTCIGNDHPLDAAEGFVIIRSRLQRPPRILDDHPCEVLSQ